MLPVLISIDLLNIYCWLHKFILYFVKVLQMPLQSHWVFSAFSATYIAPFLTKLGWNHLFFSIIQMNIQSLETSVLKALMGIYVIDWRNLLSYLRHSTIKHPLTGFRLFWPSWKLLHHTCLTISDVCLSVVYIVDNAICWLQWSHTDCYVSYTALPDFCQS
jgi:hypothetical protein